MSEQPSTSDQGLPPVAVPESKPHPIRLIVGDELKLSRLTVFLRLLLLFPHLIWQEAWGFVAGFCVFVNWWALLIKGRSPEDLHLFLARVLRYRTHLASYTLLVSNPYPTFFGRQGAHPVDVEIDGPDPQPRLVTLFRLLLAIPAFVISYVLIFVMVVIAFLGWFIALVIGRMPKGMRDLSAYCLRYEAQTTGYLMCLTSRYPSLSAGPPR